MKAIGRLAGSRFTPVRALPRQTTPVQVIRPLSIPKMLSGAFDTSEATARRLSDEQSIGTTALSRNRLA